jgi:hypothetical protein
MSTCASTSDYALLKTNYFVDEEAAGPMNTANEILCMIKQTRAEWYFNKGAYYAQVPSSNVLLE